MHLSLHKTKIVCTIGPASRSLPVLEDLIKSGMNVARLNFSHGSFSDHAKDIRNVNKAAAKLGRIVSIIADLPGAKIRVGSIKPQGIALKKGQKVTLTTKANAGTETLIPVDYKQLSKSIVVGGTIYLSDGFIQLRVESVRGQDVHCKVTMGGVLFSHKGLNLPGAKVFIDPVTRTDLAIVDFCLRQGVRAFGLSFVEKSADVVKVREFARKKGKTVYLVAKIERREAISNFDEILKAADAIMIARGDLGVEIPVEEVPSVQKRLIQKANVVGKPVITATQMLESMTENVRPTRAEVNDVANAILDGTDAVMLSEETAMGLYPVETVKMMAQVAGFTEQQRSLKALSTDEGEQIKALVAKGDLTVTDVISLNVVRSAEKLKARYILSPTSSGNTARRVCRFKPHCWVLAFSTQQETCRFLAFSYGVHPFYIQKQSDKSLAAIFKFIKKFNLVKSGDVVIVTERRLSAHQGETDSLGIVTF